MIFEGNTLTVEVGEGQVAELNFDLKNASVNKFNAETLGELKQALESLREQKGIKGLIVSSTKNVFVVGADITEFATWFKKSKQELADDVLEIHDIFSMLEDLPFPTVSAINGFSLGGGFEVALATDYRVMSTAAKVGLPEVKLGIFPGWGGTIRLSRLIGADNAIEWICTGKEQSGSEALKAGAVDALVNADQLQSAALAVLNQAANGALDYASRRTEKRGPLKLNKVEHTMVFEGAKAFVAGKAGPHYPAPLAAVRCIEEHATLARDEAARVESLAFARLAHTEVAHNLVGLFLNDQVLKRHTKAFAKSAKSVNQAAVLGAGIMGGGIAYQAALKGIPMVMKDISQKALESGLQEATKLLAKRVDRGRIQVAQMAEVLNRINPTLTYGDVEPADLVIEAVVENPQVKQSVLAELEEIVADDTIITSNTSTISISELATALTRPDRFCGMHFFNPVPVMPLVEVIRGQHTSEETVATTAAFAKAIGKNPIVVNDCPGFLVNRILFPYFNGFAALIRDGADFKQVDNVMERFGWPMGPAYLLDVVGMDTACHASEVLAAGYPERMRTDYKSAIEVMHENGRLGQKSGHGFYIYEKDKRGKPKKIVDEGVYALLESVQPTRQEFSEQTIIDRMMIPMCMETVRCLEEEIVTSPAQADMGLIWGIGFPPFRGGALRYIDAIGVAAFCRAADGYADLGAAYVPPARLRDMAGKGQTFFA
ncbi:MAG: fatty acid oxidation complex subunit alpha FadB [Gammaproteobacteria bacterium]|nr:fatty acid oxidation complex subunit alpha FadB [Gammaproteobacteria bacterium]